MSKNPAAWNKMLEFLGHHGTTTVALCDLRDYDHPQYRSLNVTKPVAAEFAKVVRNAVAGVKAGIEKGDRSLAPFDAEWQPDDGEVVYLTVANTAFEPVLAAQSAAAAISLVDTSDDLDMVRNSSFYVIHMQHQGHALRAYRKFETGRVLSRRMMFVFDSESGRLDSLQAPLFQFDERIDAIEFGGVLFILHQKNAEVMFGVRSFIEKSADTSIEAVVNALPFAEPSAFRDLCRAYPRILYKLPIIANPERLKRFSIDGIREVIKEFKLEVEIVDVKGEDCLKFDADDGKSRWDIIKLLELRHVRSQVTGDKFEANSKREVP